MQDKTINNALLALRKQIIRGHGEGLEHVEALLRLRGVPIPKPCAYRDAFKSRELKTAILDALSDGPKTGPDIYRRVAAMRPGMTYREASDRASNALTRLRKSGLIWREGQTWRQAR